eukprot:gene10229-10389_t
MRILVFGATGGTGRRTVDLSRLKILKGDLADAASLQPAMAGVDAVVFTAGVASIQQAATQKTTVYSVGGGNVLQAAGVYCRRRECTAGGGNVLQAVRQAGVPT